MSITEITSDAKCKYCMHHAIAPMKRKDGSSSERWVGHCFQGDTPRQMAANNYACDNFIPSWQPPKKD